MTKGVWYTYIEDRIKKNKNFLGCITGGTGSGKTYSALRMAEQIDPNFTIDRVIFTPLEFIKLLNSGELKKGDVIIADEFGVSANARNWQSAENQALNFILQTFRSEFNSIVFFTSPDFGFVDAAARKLFHAHLMTQGINQKEKFVTIKPYMLQINQRTGDVYYKFLKFQRLGEPEYKLGELYVGMPSKELITAYEQKKKIFVNALNQSMQKKLEEKMEIKKSKTEEHKEERINIISKLRGEGKGWKEIASMFGNATDTSIRLWFQRNSSFNEPTSHNNLISTSPKQKFNSNYNNIDYSKEYDDVEPMIAVKTERHININL